MVLTISAVLFSISTFVTLSIQLTRNTLLHTSSTHDMDVINGKVRKFQKWNGTQVYEGEGVISYVNRKRNSYVLVPKPILGQTPGKLFKTFNFFEFQHESEQNFQHHA
uniref:Uncharacterized protein n=1 Tax=Cacopsylla melanoneura TaxID=428564 RepID=A0A8D8PP35_9HEMI